MPPRRWPIPQAGPLADLPDRAAQPDAADARRRSPTQSTQPTHARHAAQLEVGGARMRPRALATVAARADDARARDRRRPSRSRPALAHRARRCRRRRRSRRSRPIRPRRRSRPSRRRRPIPTLAAFSSRAPLLLRPRADPSAARRAHYAGARPTCRARRVAPGSDRRARRRRRSAAGGGGDDGDGSLRGGRGGRQADGHRRPRTRSWARGARTSSRDGAATTGSTAATERTSSTAGDGDDRFLESEDDAVDVHDCGPGDDRGGDAGHARRDPPELRGGGLDRQASRRGSVREHDRGAAGAGRDPRPVRGRPAPRAARARSSCAPRATACCSARGRFQLAANTPGAVTTSLNGDGRELRAPGRLRPRRAARGRRQQRLHDLPQEVEGPPWGGPSRTLACWR